LSGASVHLDVKIALADAAQELTERRRLRGGGLKDKLALGKSEVHRRILLKADLLGKGLWDPDGQAVPPSLDAGLHRASS
jgi:hypothetical protein